MRLPLALVLIALARPGWSGDVKSVPDIKADVSPTNSNVQTPQLPAAAATPGVDLPQVPSLPSTELSAVQPQAPAGELKLPQAPQNLAPSAEAPAGPQAAPPAEQLKAQGDVQFDQARAVSGGLTVDAGGRLIETPAEPSALSPFVPGETASERGPPALPGLGGDGESADQLLAKALDKAVAAGRVPRSLKAELLNSVYTDPLTLLHNRLYLDANLPALAKAYPALATFKLDALKEINDSYDHDTGNKFIKAVAALSDKVVGQDGVVVRRSPTGFAVFMDAPVEDARMAAEALRLAVSRKMGDPARLLGKQAEPGTPGTISLGVTGIPRSQTPGEAYRQAFQKAEKARGLAKELGGGDRTAYDDGDSKIMDRRTLEEAVTALKRGRVPGVARRLEEAEGQDLGKLVEDRDSTVPTAKQMAEIIGQLKDPQLKGLAFQVAYKDRLTGLLNRRYLFDHLEFLLNGYTAYLALDLDKFGDLNAELGEEKADLVLKEFGALLAEAVRGQDALPLHLSGEEFTVLAGQRQKDPGAFAELVREKVKAELGSRVAQRYGIKDPDTGEPYRITISIGVAPIKREGGEADKRLELVDAMAESLLQRAKANGRDRVEVGAEGLTSLLGRVVRVDESVRQAVAKLFPPAGRAPGPEALLDNSLRPRAQVLKALGFNPGSEGGRLLSDPEKGGSETWLVEPKGKPARVVKISDREVIANEILLRAIVEDFETFNAALASPRAVAYDRLWPFKPVLVQENFEGAHKSWMGSDNLPARQKVALALLAGTFGVHGFNPGAFLDVTWARALVVDFEFSRARFELRNGPLPIGAGSFHPWVASNYLNDINDYLPALRAWRRVFAKRETQEELQRLLRRAGVPERRIPEDLATFAHNLSILEKELARDVATGNKDFLEHARWKGLDDAQARGLSFVNKSAHQSPQGGVFRDVVRLLNARITGIRGSGRFALDAEEWLALSRARPNGLTRADRDLLVRLALQRQLAGAGGGPVYAAAEVRAALDKLDVLLKPKA